MDDARVLRGRVALVTGGSRGIGAAICDRLAALGADVAINYNSHLAEADAVRLRLQQRHGARAECLQGDVSSDASLEAMFGRLREAFGRLDILVNNAGFEDCHAAESMPMAAWDSVMAVNLRGAFRCAQLAFPLLRGAGGGLVVNMSSIHDDVPRKGIAHYCAAKAGLVMLTKCLALEWAEHGIRVVGISPGAIETDMNRHVLEADDRYHFKDWIPAGRAGHVDEVAALVAFLASPGAAYITGTTIHVDGAYRLSTIRYDDRPGRHP